MCVLFFSRLVLEVATLLCRYAKIHCMFVLFTVLAGLSGISSQGAYSEILDNLIFFLIEYVVLRYAFPNIHA